MTWNKVINGAITAALSGGAAAALALGLDPSHFDWYKTTSMFLAGSAIGLINWLRETPWNKQ